MKYDGFMDTGNAISRDIGEKQMKSEEIKLLNL